MFRKEQQTSLIRLTNPSKGPYYLPPFVHPFFLFEGERFRGGWGGISENDILATSKEIQRKNQEHFRGICAPPPKGLSFWGAARTEVGLEEIRLPQVPLELRATGAFAGCKSADRRELVGDATSTAWR